MKTFCALICFMVSLEFVFAQQTPVYSQYFMNGFVVNPSMAGIDETTKVQISARDYMIGIGESPKIFTASVNGRFRRKISVKRGKLISQNGRVGMGGFVYSDHNGPVTRIGMQYTYAYHIDMLNSQLSFGLSAALSQTSIDADKLDFNNPEPLLKDGFGNLTYAPDAALGILYKKRESYIGFTVSNLFQRSIHSDKFDYNHIMYQHYFLLGGTSFDTGQESYITPAFLLKATSNCAFQGEFSTRFSYRDDFWLAATYRTPQIAALMIGMRVQMVFIGYTYEYRFNDLKAYRLGAHELCLIYRFGNSTWHHNRPDRY